MSVSFPRLSARTRRFTLGLPRNITVSSDGGTVWFIRTPDGVTPTGQLWAFDVASGSERLLVDPAALVGDHDDLSPQERARRERSRESGGGLVSFSVDDAGATAVFALSGMLWVTDLRSGTTSSLATGGPVIDPRIDPTGHRIAYVSERALYVIDVDGSHNRAIAVPDTDTQAWGLAEFIAAEELSRYRGFWWSPGGDAILAEHYDEAPVQRWHIADPAQPQVPPVEQRYPAAGTPNAQVSLWILDLAGDRRQVDWDASDYEYVQHVSWTSHGDPVVQVLSRDHRAGQILGVNPDSGATRVLRQLHDDAWVESLPSPPRFGPAGRLIYLDDRDGKRRLIADDTPLSDEAWQLRTIVSATDDGVITTASQEPTEVQVVKFGYDGTCDVVTSGSAVHGAAERGSTLVISRSGLDDVASSYTVLAQRQPAGRLGVMAAEAPFIPQVELIQAGPRALRTAVLFPRDHQMATRRLPVLMDPYGGPYSQRVLTSARMFTEAQWLADQGFCVIVADGRGSPGRDYAWERAVGDGFATVTLEDQIAALETVAQRYPDDVDPSRVGIRGWSFGGYLAALAVLTRPDVFHGAVAGAPVTDWRLYDTAYTERYLGDPNARPAVYDAHSLLDLAPSLQRPLMLIHGLADDNVVSAHTLRFSSALLAGGRPHTVLPLSGITHMATDETVAENLIQLQVDFLTDALSEL